MKYEGQVVFFLLLLDCDSKIDFYFLLQYLINKYIFKNNSMEN